MRKVNYPDDLEMPNDFLLDHKWADHAMKTAVTKLNYDVSDGSMKDTYPALYNKIKETTCTIMANGGKGFFWLIMPMEMADWIEVGTYEKYGRPKFVPEPADQIPLGYTLVTFWGILDRRWRMYVDPLLPHDTIIVGTGYSKKPGEYYGVLKVSNFVK